MIKPDETFDGTWPFAPRFHQVAARGGAAPFSMHYVDEGPSQASPIVCLHGEPTWGYLYRKMIPRLAERHRAYSAPFETPEECIGAAEFPLDAYHQRIREFVLEGARGLDSLMAKPAMLAEGMCDHAIPPELAIADFQGIWPGRPIVRLPGVGHFCQEDAPDVLVALIEQFVQSS